MPLQPPETPRWLALASGTMHLLLLLLTACSPAPPRVAPPPSPTPEEPSLVFRSGQRERSYTRSQLLAHPARRVLKIVDQSGYEGQPMTYEAVPLAALVEGLEMPPGSELHYRTRDGFSSSLEARLATSRDPDKALAYIAVEPPDRPWPRFEGRDYTAGPFYLVWEHPERSGIGREEWPFMLSSFTVEPSLESRYPGLVPARRDGPEHRGYRVFVKNCFPCHTMDGLGTGKMGPDLNRPTNPTEYMTESALRQLVRDPASLRSWPEMKMSGFPVELISDSELDDLLAYLRSRRKASQ